MKKSSTSKTTTVLKSIKGAFDFVHVPADTYVMYADQMKQKSASTKEDNKQTPVKKKPNQRKNKKA